METTDTNLTENIYLPEPKRPQFLTVLCILTWIMSGIMFLSTVNSILNKPSPEQQAEQIAKMESVSPEAAASMEAAFQKMDETPTIIYNLATIVAIALSVLGAIMMWQLKKAGFFVYLIGELLPYIGLLIVGTTAFDMMSTILKMDVSVLMAISIGIMLLIDGVFIAMYAANLKHMK